MRGKKPYQILWLICTLALAGLATGVRLWQESTAFEGDFGLPVRGATASVAMVCVLVMAAAVLCILAARQPIVRPPRAQVRGRRWAMSFFATGDLVFLALMWFSAFSALAAVPMLFGQGRALWKAYQVALAMKTWQGGDNGVLSMVTAVLALLAFFGLLQIGRDGYHPGRRSRGGFWAALPACAGCGWLLNTYRNCAADPVLWDYVPLLLAVIAGMLMYTDWAGMSCAAAPPHPVAGGHDGGVLLGGPGLQPGHRPRHAAHLPVCRRPGGPVAAAHQPAKSAQGGLGGQSGHLLHSGCRAPG